jgi:SGNH hydrolase-like domain, acetyltransferase AlgX
MRNGTLVERTGTQQTRLSYAIVQLKGFLAARSHLYQLVIKARRAAEKRAEAVQLSSHVLELFEESGDTNVQRGVELTSQLLDRIHTLAAAQGSQVVVVLLPLAVQLSPQKFSEFVQVRGGQGRSLVLDRPQHLMMQVGQRTRITVIDLLPEFTRWTATGGGQLYLPDDGHWNMSGHRLAATIATRELVERRLVR